MTNEPTIVVYGKATCADWARSKALLEREHVAYRFVGVDDDPAAAEYVQLQTGRMSTPYIVFGDGSTQTEPSDEQLRARLVDLALVAPETPAGA